MITRLFRFGAVGVLCLLIQIFILLFLERFIPPVLANAIGFIISAQLNFILSYRYTWDDSARKNGLGLVVTWVKFNLVVLFSACINATAFSLISYMLIGMNTIMATEQVPNIVAAIGATVISTICTFAINHLFVLKPEKRSDHERNTRNRNVSASVE